MSLLIGVLVASLAGSVHCAAMCGGFVCVYAGVGARSGIRGIAPHVAYHGGRLVSYVALGLAAGALGARVDSVARLARVERGAAIVAGMLMILWASSRIASSLGVRLPRTPASGAVTWVQRQLGELLLAFKDQSALVRSGAIGLLTTLLPCGWLYTFVVTAGGTGNPMSGALVMAMFWLGTIPLLLGVGLGAQRVSRPLARHLPLAGAALVLVLGFLSLTGKLRQIPSIGAPHSHAAHVSP